MKTFLSKKIEKSIFLSLIVTNTFAFIFILKEKRNLRKEFHEKMFFLKIVFKMTLKKSASKLQ